MSAGAATWATCPSWCTDCWGIQGEGYDRGVRHEADFGNGVALYENRMAVNDAVTAERAIAVHDPEFLSAEEARQLAASLSRAADVLEAAGGRYSRDPNRNLGNA